MKKKTTAQATPKRKATKPSPKARKPSQIDRIEAAISKVHEELLSVRSIAHHARTAARVNTGKLDLLLSGATFMQELDKAKEEPKPLGLQPGDYTDASKETADALTAMGWEWWDDDRHKEKYIRFGQNSAKGKMVNINQMGATCHLTPAEFLSRASVTAKELRLVPVVEEPKVLNVGQWIKFRDGSWQTKEYGGIAKVKSGPDEEGHYLTEPAPTEPMGYYFAVDEAGPATEQEIADHLAEQEARANAEKMAKLKWGVRVKTQKGREYRIACDKPNEDGLYRVAPDVAYTYDAPMLSVDEFTVIEQP